MERDVERYLVLKITKLGGLCIKINSTTTRGLPDRMVVYNGQIIFIETKTEEGKLSDYQRYIINLLKDQGAPVLIIRSKEEVDMLCCMITRKEE